MLVPGPFSPEQPLRPPSPLLSPCFLTVQPCLSGSSSPSFHIHQPDDLMPEAGKAPRATGQLATFPSESLTLPFEQLADVLQIALESPDLCI